MYLYDYVISLYMAQDTTMVVVSKEVRDRLKELRWDMRTESLNAVIEELINEHESTILSKRD